MHVNCKSFGFVGCWRALNNQESKSYPTMFLLAVSRPVGSWGQDPCSFPQKLLCHLNNSKPNWHTHTLEKVSPSRFMNFQIIDTPLCGNNSPLGNCRWERGGEKTELGLWLALMAGDFIKSKSPWNCELMYVHQMKFSLVLLKERIL